MVDWFPIQRILKIFAFVFISYLIISLILGEKVSTYENIYVCVIIGIIFLVQDIFFPTVNISNCKQDTT